MGLDYEYHLFFPQERMWDVLLAVASIAKPNGTTTIVLPDREIMLPFDSGFKNGTIVFDNSTKGMGFDTDLYFSADEQIEEYQAKDPMSEEWKKLRRDNKGRVAIASISLIVTTDLRHSTYIENWKPGVCSFEFGAATTSMSLLFEQSKSIRRAFKRLLKLHGGLFGYFHDSDYANFPTYVFWPPDMSAAEAKARLLAES